MSGMELLALNGSPSLTSKTHALAEAAVEVVGAGRVVNLGELDAEALLGRRKSDDVSDAIEAIQATPLLLIATPIYRATYSGLLKILFDQLGLGALNGTVCVLGATGGSPAHSLAVDTGLRPLIASLGGLGVARPVYLTTDAFTESGELGSEGTATLRAALTEALVLVEALHNGRPLQHSLDRTAS